MKRHSLKGLKQGTFERVRKKGTDEMAQKRHIYKGTVQKGMVEIECRYADSEKMKF